MIIFAYIAVLVLGLIWGSFLNCFAWRLYHNKTLWDRSICPKCFRKINWYDNIPVLSFLMLKAKCRGCKKAISWQYPIVEVIVGLLFVFVFYYHTKDFVDYLFFDQLASLKVLVIILRDWFLVFILTLIFLMDFKWYIIVDKVSLPACLIVLIFNIYLGMPWSSILISAIIGAGFFLLQFVISKGKWIGGGDIRLGLLMGIILGWPYILVALFLAYLLGAVTGVLLMMFGKKKIGSQLPFGTFLTIATIITIFFGDFILNWYMGLY